jgi:hypothetical protein
MADEAPSFNTSIDSILEGLIFFILPTGIPSTIKRGLVFPIVPIPRIKNL